VDNVLEPSINPRENQLVSPTEVWNSCLDFIKQNVRPLTFKTWFEPIKPLSLEKNVLTVQVPSSFFYEWIEERYLPYIQSALARFIGPGAKLSYSIVAPESTQGQQLELTHSGKNVIVSEATPSDVLSPEKTHNVNISIRSGTLAPVNNGNSFPVQANLNSRYTFDNFIRGDGNQFARAAALNVANNPSTTAFNPLVIYGGVGLGKTHLIQAIGNFALENKTAGRVAYVSSERFTIEFVEAIEKNKTADFSNYYRSMDILIVDDIQFFSGKERTQDNFFHTFNTLHQLKKQIVLSSDRPPKEISGLDERLLSRFQWGLTVDIQPPDLETRIAILQRRAQDDNIEIPLETIEYIATNVKSNIRELEGCYITLVARHTFEGCPLNISTAEHVLQKVINMVKKPVTVGQIQTIVAEHFSISEDLLRAKTRKQEIVHARQVAMYLAKKHTDSSLKTIGLYFGGRDHSTVIHAVQAIEHDLAQNPALFNRIKQIEKKLLYLST